ncbi:MAG: hypothetical protein RL684_1400 [Pseudomonadota bacterium]
MPRQRWLVLWRHGEAEPGSAQGDRARTLTRRGLQQARAAARQIAALCPPPTLLLTSSAPRAAATAACAAEVLALPATAQVALDALYLASPATLREALRRHAAHAPCILLVGHNPGLSELGAGVDATREGALLDTAGWWRIDVTDELQPEQDT